MLWIQGLHVIFVVTWFAGLFYLPRIFVYYAQADDPATKRTLATMARKLFKFVTPLMVLALVLGIWRLSYALTGYLETTWMQLKLAGVLCLLAYHIQCGIYVTRINSEDDSKTHVFYRFFNEVPVLFLFAIVLLVYIRPT